MRTALLLFVLLASPALAGQTVWKWVDDKGVTHYSDRPVPGATRMDISTGKPAASAAPAYPYSGESSRPEAQEGPRYTTFEIWRPAEGESIVNTGGQIAVNLRLEPALRPGHQLSLYLDGQLVQGSSPDATMFALGDVPRGEHQLTAVISDHSGQRVQESAPVRFFVRQESIAQPPVGPALRPKPKPAPQPGAANKPLLRQPAYADLNPAPAPIDPATNLPRKDPKPKPMPAPIPPPSDG